MTDPQHRQPGQSPDAAGEALPDGALEARAQPLHPGLPTGTGLGKYRILERIRTYHHAVVYKARDGMLDRLVTLKQMATDLLDDPIACGNFKREAHFLARCSFDPRFVVNVFELIEDEIGLFIVEEYVDGHWLDSLIAKRRVGPRDAPRLLRTAGAGLKLLHSLSIVHRCIDPTNILVTPAGVGKIANLSCAAHESDASRPPVITPRYAAPELLMEQGYDDRVDVYSLGMTLYEVCVGRRALEQFIAQVAGTGPAGVGRWIDWVANPRETLPRADAVNPLVPPSLASVVERMTAKRLEDRFTSIEEAIDTLAAAPTAAKSLPPARPAVPAVPRSAPVRAPAHSIPSSWQPPASVPADARPTTREPGAPATTPPPLRPATQPHTVRPAAQVSPGGPATAARSASTSFVGRPADAQSTAPRPRSRRHVRATPPAARVIPRIEHVPPAPEAHESYKKRYPRILKSAFVAALMIAVATYGGKWAWQSYFHGSIRSPARIVFTLAEDAYRAGQLEESRVRFRELSNMKLTQPSDVALQRAAGGWLELIEAHRALDRSDYEAVQLRLASAREQGVESFRIQELQTRMWDKKDNERMVTEGMEALAREDFAAAERAFAAYEERVGKGGADSETLREALESAKRDYRHRQSLKEARQSLLRDDFATALGSLGQAEAIRITSETRDLRKEIIDAKNRFEWILTGDEALMSRDFSRAVSSYERASESAPSAEVETKLKTARALLFLEQAKRAIAAGDVLASEDLLRNSLYNADTDEARHQMDRYAPAFEAARLVKNGDAAMLAGKFDEAEQVYRSALPQLPESARKKVQDKILQARRGQAMDRGDKAFLRGDMTAALLAYREAQRIKNGPDVEEKISRIQAQIP